MTDIEKLKELEAKATPGPWVRQTMEPQTLGYEWVDAPGYTDVAVCRELTKFDLSNRIQLRPELDEITANTEFIVAARNALPDLLASLASKDAEIERLKADLAREEGAHSITVDQRDAAENCIGDIYFEITGRAPEWSNQFGYDDAFEEISVRAEAAESRLTTALAALGEAREALEPFSDADEYLEAETSGFVDDDPLTLTYRNEEDCATDIGTVLSFGRFRKARATLAKLNTLGGNDDGK